MTDNRERKQEEFYKIPKYILDGYKLSASEIKIYALLKSFLDATGEAFPSNGWLSDRSGVDKRSVIRAINNLCDLNIFKVFRDKGVRYITDSFIIHPDEAEEGGNFYNKNDRNSSKVAQKDPADEIKECANRGDKNVMGGDKNVTGGVTKMSLEVPDTLYTIKKSVINKNICQVSSISEQPQASPLPCRASPTTHSQTEQNIVSVFEHWKAVMGHHRSKLGEKRKSVISKALKLGYSSTELCEAINGCKKTPFNMGDNKNNQVYDDLTIIFREGNIDRFIKNASSVLVNEADSITARNAQTSARWIQDMISKV